MKKTSYKLLSCVAVGSLLLTSCYKKFDTNSYAPPFLINGFSSVSQIAPANLVAYWSFDGSLTDSVTGTAGTNNGASFVPGFKGKAYQGSNTAYSTFDPNNTLKNLQSYTISFWMKSVSNSGAIGIFTLSNPNDFWGNIDIYQDGGSGTDAVFKVHMNNVRPGVLWGGQFTDTKIPINLWVNITITYDAATSIFNVYQNASQVGVNTPGNPAATKGPKINGSDPSVPPVIPYGALQFSNPAKIAFGTFQFQVGLSNAGPQSWASNFAGNLDEFRIYNKALSAGEISSMVVLQGKGK